MKPFSTMRPGTGLPKRSYASSVLFIVAAFAAGFSSCSKPPQQQSDAPDQTYTVRGRIDALPHTSSDRFLHVHHERIPDFVSSDGRVVGMKEMSMAFPALARNLSLDGFSVGDPVELTFEVRWKGRDRTTVTSIRKLTDDIQLQLNDPSPSNADKK